MATDAAVTLPEPGALATSRLASNGLWLTLATGLTTLMLGAVAWYAPVVPPGALVGLFAAGFAPAAVAVGLLSSRRASPSLTPLSVLGVAAFWIAIGLMIRATAQGARRTG